MRYILHFSRSGGFLGLLKFEDFEEAKNTLYTLTKLGYVCYIQDKERKEKPCFKL